MPRDFFPRPDAQAVTFTLNFSTRINAEPELYHVDPQRAAEYAALQQAFSQAYWAAANPGSSSRADRVRRREARAAVEATTRELASSIRYNLNIPPDKKILVGVKVRRMPRRIARPADAPVVCVQSVDGRMVTVDLFEAESGKRRLPKGVTSAMVFSFVGEHPPAQFRTWGRFRG